MNVSYSYVLFYCFAERKQGGYDHLEVLHAEGDTDDGDAQDDAEEKMDQGDLPPAGQNPDDVHDGRQAAGLFRLVYDLMTEGPEGIGSELEELHAERDAYDCDAQPDAHAIVYQRYKEAVEDNPEYIA